MKYGVWAYLFAINVVVFFIELLFPQTIHYLALTPSLAISMPWTFITSMFLHAGFFHLFLNMFALIMFGPILEYKLGSKKFFYLYLLAGIAGNIGYFLWAFGSQIPGLGASGAIYGVLGALALLEPNLIVLVWFIPMRLWTAAVFWVFIELFSLGIPSDIANIAHLAGMAVGFSYAYLLKKGMI